MLYIHIIIYECFISEILKSDINSIFVAEPLGGVHHQGDGASQHHIGGAQRPAEWEGGQCVGGPYGGGQPQDGRQQATLSKRRQPLAVWIRIQMN